jgi:hypothetical protein
MGRSDGLGTDAIQPSTEMFEGVASNDPSISFGLRMMRAMVSRSALLSRIQEGSRGRPAIRLMNLTTEGTEKN